MAARQYRSTVEAKTLQTSINNSIGSMTLNSVTTLPSSYPYTLVVDADTSSEEIVTVTGTGGGNSLTITRGQDGTSAQEHDAGAVVKHMVTARDLQDAQNHVEASTGGYTIISDGQGNTTRDLHGIASGEGAVVGTLKTQTLTNKTLTSPKINENVALTATSTELNVLDGITASTTELNYTDGVTAAIQTQLNNNTPIGSVTMWVTGTAPTGWLLCQGQAVSRTTYASLFSVISTTYGVGDNSTTFNLPDLRGRVPMGAGTGRNVADSADLTARTLGAKISDAETVTLTAAQSGSPAHDHSVTSVTGGTHTASGSISTGSHSHTLTMEYSGDATHDHAISGISNPRPAMKSDGGSAGTIGNSNGTAIASEGNLGGSASVTVANHSHTIDIAENTAANAAEAHTNTQPSTVINFIIKH